VFLNESATPTSTFRFGSGSPKTNNKTLTSAFRFGSGSSKTNSEIQLLLFDLEAKRIVEVDFYFSFWQRSYPKRIVNSNFCYSIWKPKRILEVDFRFSFWSGSSKTNSEKSTSANDNWFWSGDGERMAEKYTDPGTFTALTNRLARLYSYIKPERECM